MLYNLFEVLSPSGKEKNIREYIKSNISNKFDSVSVDNTGNLIARKNGNGDKICIECGMDSRGIMIVSADEKTASFSAVGQLTPSYLVGKKIRMENGSLGIVRYSGELTDSTKISDLTLEYDGNLLKIGDFGTVCGDFTETDHGLLANGLSDIIGTAAVIEAISAFNGNADLTVVFSAQKALGGRGIRSFFGVNGFDKVFSIVGCKCGGSTKAGCGCVVVVKDKTAVASPVLKREVEAVSEEHNIKIQPCVSDESFFMGNISHAGEGNDCIALGIPVAYKDKTMERVEKADFSEAVRLIKHIIKG